MADQPRRPLRGLRDLLRTDHQLRAEVDEELETYLELRARDLEHRGYPPAAARQEALRRFGNMEQTRAACLASDRRRVRRKERREIVTETRSDVTVALRHLRRRPAFTAVAAATLAIGIGATTAIFSAADHMLLRPLPYRAAEDVVTLWETDRESGERKREVSAGNFMDWRAKSGAFSEMALAEPFGFDLTNLEPPEPARAWLVTEGWFEALGVVPRLGRGFTAEEHRRGERVVVISDRMWKARYAGDPGVIGRAIELDGDPATVVGVLPPGLDFPRDGDVWAPKVWRSTPAYDEAAARNASYMLAVGRLRPGVALEQARRDMDRVAAEIAAEHPGTNAGVGANVVPLREHILGDTRPALLVLLGAVAFVLLIACANVASLFLAKGAERERELAVRAALGAGRGRLMRQLTTESLVLAVGSGVLGAGLAFGGMHLFKVLAPADLPRLTEMGIDGRALLFAAAISLFTAVLFGLAPSLRFSRPELAGVLKGAGRPGSAGRGQHRLRGTLVVAEIALALVLLVGAGLLGRSFARLATNDLGFDPEGVASIQLFLWDLYPTGPQRQQAVSEIRERFAAVPGVSAVAVTTAMPFHPHMINAQDALLIEGRPQTADAGRSIVYTTVASAGYFGLMGIPLLAGRDFDERDRADAPPVAIITRTLARRYFPDEDPLGKRVTIGVMSRPLEREIVGVVDDVRPTALDSEPWAELIIPYEQSLTGSVTFVARTAVPPLSVLPALRQAVAEVNPRQVVYHAATAEAMIGQTLVARRFSLALLGALALVALALASIGIYGLLSFTTALRTGEIGIRMALGARRGDVVAMIVGGGVLLALPGIALGVVGALLLTRFLGSMLYETEPTDPLTFAGVAALMLAVAVAATLGPARRAAGADPMRALKEE